MIVRERWRNKVGNTMEKRNVHFTSFIVLLLGLGLLCSCVLLEELQAIPYEGTDEAAVSKQTAEPAEDWFLTAKALGLGIGNRVTLNFPPNGTSSAVWGTNVYTDDSSIGSAAVHMGLITFVYGGSVTIEILDGLSSYEGTSRNGVVSESYGAWDGSFAFVNSAGELIVPSTIAQKAQPQVSPVVAKKPETPLMAEQSVDWSTTASQWSGQIGKRIHLTLPAGGSAGSVWGSGVYTDDSSIGTAAVHLGLIPFQTGGSVTIEIRPGQDSYQASTANGVSTEAYGSWGGSFIFIDKDGNAIQAKPMEIHPTSNFIAGSDWSTNAVQWAGSVGSRYTLELPRNGSPGPVWGTTVYTNDSSIGSAAVHAGLITFPAGGKVTIEILGGMPSYEGTSRNGVVSESYGAWDGSYQFIY